MQESYSANLSFFVALPLLILLVLSLVVDLLGCLFTPQGQSYDYNPTPPSVRKSGRLPLTSRLLPRLCYRLAMLAGRATGAA